MSTTTTTTATTKKTMAERWLEPFDGDATRALANVGKADASIEQDWEVGATIVTFRDCSSIIFDGPTVIIEGAYR